MISSAKCDSMNGISRGNLNTQESSQNTDPFSSKVTNICNLPVELIQKIAFNLNSKDYASLRATNKIISESLENFSVMSNKLMQGCVSGDTEKNFRERMCDKLIRSLLGGDQKKEITLSLRNCFASSCRLIEGYTEAGTTYLPDNYKYAYSDRIEKAIDLCRKGIKSFIVSGEHRCFNPTLYPGKLWYTAIAFTDSEINTKSLNDIF